MTTCEDRQEISDLAVRYATGIDRRDWGLFATVFTDDCVLDYGAIGRWDGVEAVTDFMRASHAMAGHTLHRISNQSVEFDGDHGRAQSYVDAYVMAPDNSSGVNAVGFYEDEVVRTEHGWRIARRTFTPVRVVAVQNP